MALVLIVWMKIRPICIHSVFDFRYNPTFAAVNHTDATIPPKKQQKEEKKKIQQKVLPDEASVQKPNQHKYVSSLRPVFNLSLQPSCGVRCTFILANSKSIVKYYWQY